jgi:sulfate adenylyltransferase subunit 1 (EFTu-like GTPase family)
VQYVIRPQKDDYHDFRGFAGVIRGGVFRVGDPVIVLPAGKTSRIKGIHTFDTELEVAYTPMSVTLLLEDEIDISRGDMIVKPDNVPYVDRDLDVMVSWMHDAPLAKGKKYRVKVGAKSARAMIKDVRFRVDIQHLERDKQATELGLNEIGRVHLKLAEPVVYDAYSRNRQTGSMIFIEEGTNLTVGAGLICEPIKETPHPDDPGI